MNKGFTLIELLVVVLIIGILSAIALPQYRKSVLKARSAEAVILLNSVWQAAERYHLETSQWPSNISDLDVQPPKYGNSYGSQNFSISISGTGEPFLVFVSSRADTSSPDYYQIVKEYGIDGTGNLRNLRYCTGSDEVCKVISANPNCNQIVSFDSCSF